jgi:hypothetical protein
MGIEQRPGDEQRLRKEKIETLRTQPSLLKVIALHHHRHIKDIGYARIGAKGRGEGPITGIVVFDHNYWDQRRVLYISPGGQLILAYLDIPTQAVINSGNLSQECFEDIPYDTFIQRLNEIKKMGEAAAYGYPIH